jgi:hypothetical protein
MNQKRRKRIGKGIYRDAYGLAGTVKVGNGHEAQQREKRFPFDTPLKDIKDWQEAMRAELRPLQRRPVALTRGTLEADAKVYLAQVKIWRATRAASAKCTPGRTCTAVCVARTSPRSISGRRGRNGSQTGTR